MDVEIHTHTHTLVCFPNSKYIFLLLTFSKLRLHNKKDYHLNMILLKMFPEKQMSQILKWNLKFKVSCVVYLKWLRILIYFPVEFDNYSMYNSDYYLYFCFFFGWGHFLAGTLYSCIQYSVYEISALGSMNCVVSNWRRFFKKPRVIFRKDLM